jgi:soluble lytic murein transglycosylase-like protein
VFGGRQTLAVWGSFAVGCFIAAQAQRPEKPQRLFAPSWGDDPQGMAIPLENSPFSAATPLEERVITVATRKGLDPALVLAVVQAESGQSQDAVSPKGAIGLMQVLPETAVEVGFPNPADPASNLEAGCTYLSALLANFGGDVELALAAYNAGPGAVRRWGTVPPYRETKNFIARVASKYEQLTGLDLAGATRFSYYPSAPF